MDLTGVIAALASGHGPAPRALLRLSGDGAWSTLRSILDALPHRPGLHAARLSLPAFDPPHQSLALPCLVALFEAPASYTGQDVAEIQVPGQPALVERVLALMLAQPGVRAAQPGEFTARALLCGKLGPEQAEGVQALIAARSAAEAHAARRLLSGETGAAYRALADDIAAALALVEAGIDFTDQEDVVPISPRDLVHRLRNMVFALRCVLGPRAAVERWSQTPRVVLTGPPNAGKSTLFNTLLGRHRAVVSDAPGTTRDAVEERLDLRDAGRQWGIDAVTLVDAAGLDDALALRGPLDRAGQDAARDALARADVIVHCDPLGRFDDMSRPAHETSECTSPASTVLRVRTKADLVLVGASSGAPRSAADVSVCALDGWGVAALRRAIADAACAAARAGHGAAGEAQVLPRHRRALAAAHESIAEALERAEPFAHEHALRDPEVIAGLLRSALDAVGEIAGAISPDDVIGRIFATFCVGK